MEKNWNNKIFKKAVLLLIVSLLMLLGACSTGQKENTNSKMEGPGFDSPEGAVVAYLEALRDSDHNAMMGTFAIESFSGNYDFEGFIKRRGAYSPMSDVRMPNSNEFVSILNTENRRNTVGQMITRQYLRLCSPELVGEGDVTSMKNRDISEFVAQLSEELDNTKLQTIKVLGFIPPSTISDVYKTKTNQQHQSNAAENYGADQILSRVAVFELEGEEILLFCELIDYDGKWYIYNFYSNIGNLFRLSSYMEGIVPVNIVENEIDVENLMVPVESNKK